MKLETFFEKFDQFADAPNAVAKMRELVLQLGVTGKLTHRGDSWRLAPLGEVVRLRRGYDLPTQSRNEGEFPIYAANGTVGFHDKPAVKGPGVVTGRSGSIGKVHYVPRDYWPLNTALYVEDFFGNDPEFACLLLRSLHLERYSNCTAVPTLNRNVVHKEVVRVPALAEQKRIVAKVDELMALCDRLEAQQQERETRHAALARASLARFADAPTPSNLQFLFHSSYAITPADLRKSILALAVQGKLVPQDPNDEPAEIALSRCRVDMKRWGVTQDEERQDVPGSWTWIRFAGVGEQRLGKMLDAQKNRGKSKPYLRNTNVQWMRFELNDVKEMRVEEREEEELRLKHGDLLICEGGEPGRCAIWRDETAEMHFQKALHRVRPCDAILPEFLALNLQNDCRNEVLAGYFTGATIKHLTGRSLSAYPIPIPPLAEQRRIVAKVDQLMALVDQLEVQLATSHATAAKLLEALVAELTSQAGPLGRKYEG